MEPGPLWPSEPVAQPASAGWPTTAAPEPAVPPTSPFGTGPAEPPFGSVAAQGFGAPPESTMPDSTMPGFTTPPDVPTSPGLTPPGGFAPQPGLVPPPGYGPSPYGAPPPGYPPPPPKSRKGLVIGLVVGAVVLVLVCCGGGFALLSANSKPSAGGARSGTAATPSSSPSPTAQAVSTAEYAATLSSDETTLESKMNALAGAATITSVQGAAMDLSTALQYYSDHLRGLAPAGDTGFNKDLADALATLGGEVESISTSAGTHTLCAGSPAVATLSTSSAADVFRSAVKEVTAASPSYVFGGFLPPPTNGTNRRLTNGQQIKKASGGSGQLTAENQGDKDAVLTLAADNSNSATAVFYVQAGQKATVKGIKDGSYHVYIASGSDWDGNLREFTVDCKTSENTDAMAFTTTRNTYSEWTLTFGITSGGTDPLTPVDPSQVPA